MLSRRDLLCTQSRAVQYIHDECSLVPRTSVSNKSLILWNCCTFNTPALTLASHCRIPRLHWISSNSSSSSTIFFQSNQNTRGRPRYTHTPTFSPHGPLPRQPSYLLSHHPHLVRRLPDQQHSPQLLQADFQAEKPASAATAASLEDLTPTLLRSSSSTTVAGAAMRTRFAFQTGPWFVAQSFNMSLMEGRCGCGGGFGEGGREAGGGEEDQKKGREGSSGQGEAMRGGFERCGGSRAPG